MALTSAMLTGLSGLNANQIRIDTIGDNVANINTTAFKGSRASFENQFSLMLSGGTGPNDASGGTNPSQVGLGTVLGSSDGSSGSAESASPSTTCGLSAAIVKLMG